MTDDTRYRQLLDLVTQGVIESSPDGEILLVNEAFARLLGYESAQDLSRSVSRAEQLYADSEDRPEQVERAARSAPGDSHAVELRRKDGQRMWVHARVIATHAPDGSLVRLTGVVDEIEAHHLTQHALDDAVKRIEARERTLLAEVVHDEPLQLIAAALLHVDSLRRQVPGPAAETLEQVAALLDRSGEQLRRLITTLTLPDLEAGLGAVLRDLAEGIFLDGRTVVDVTVPEHVPLSASSSSMAYLVLREALVNVRKHARAEHVDVAVVLESDAVVLSVADDGVGSEKLTAGSGHLGVPAMRARAQAIGAGLDMTSQVGYGTTVTLRVPRSVPYVSR